MEYGLSIKDLPEEERPRERMRHYGAEMLSNAELLAIIISTGSKNESALSLCQRVLSEKGRTDGLSFLFDMSVEELANIKGIGIAKASKLKAVAELGRRFEIDKKQFNPVIKSPTDVAQVLIPKMRDLKVEHFQIVHLNIKNRILKIEDVSVGTINASIVHPREVFRKAIKDGSAALILVHNHPSGECDPSREDIALTKRLCEVGELIGIRVLDHLIIGGGDYASLKQMGLME